jgi:hypothetical protein
MLVRYEQAVYGSFPFWRRGYGVLARSSACHPEWLAALRAASQRYGEPPAGTAEASGFFTMRLKRGPWMIVGVSPQGADDQDRPGALAFHALFVGRWSYAWTGADPFTFADALRRDWRGADLGSTLPVGCRNVPLLGLERSTQPTRGQADERVAPILAALMQGRQVTVQSATPIDDLARAVWRALPIRVRLRASVATWAFDNANRFDLVALPKLTGRPHLSSDLILILDETGR